MFRPSDESNDNAPQTMSFSWSVSSEKKSDLVEACNTAPLHTFSASTHQPAHHSLSAQQHHQLLQLQMAPPPPPPPPPPPHEGMNGVMQQLEMMTIGWVIKVRSKKAVSALAGWPASQAPIIRLLCAQSLVDTENWTAAEGSDGSLHGLLPKQLQLIVDVSCEQLQLLRLSSDSVSSLFDVEQLGAVQLIAGEGRILQALQHLLDMVLTADNKIDEMYAITFDRAFHALLAFARLAHEAVDAISHTRHNGVRAIVEVLLPFSCCCIGLLRRLLQSGVPISRASTLQEKVKPCPQPAAKKPSKRGGKESSGLKSATLGYVAQVEDFLLLPSPQSEHQQSPRWSATLHHLELVLVSQTDRTHPASLLSLCNQWLMALVYVLNTRNFELHQSKSPTKEAVDRIMRLVIQGCNSLATTSDGNTCLMTLAAVGATAGWVTSPSTRIPFDVSTIQRGMVDVGDKVLQAVVNVLFVTLPKVCLMSQEPWLIIAQWSPSFCKLVRRITSHLITSTSGTTQRGSEAALEVGANVLKMLVGSWKQFLNVFLSANVYDVAIRTRNINDLTGILIDITESLGRNDEAELIKSLEEAVQAVWCQLLRARNHHAAEVALLSLRSLDHVLHERCSELGVNKDVFAVRTLIAAGISSTSLFGPRAKQSSLQSVGEGPLVKWLLDSSQHSTAASDGSCDRDFEQQFCTAVADRITAASASNDAAFDFTSWFHCLSRMLRGIIRLSPKRSSVSLLIHATIEAMITVSDKHRGTTSLEMLDTVWSTRDTVVCMDFFTSNQEDSAGDSKAASSPKKSDITSVQLVAMCSRELENAFQLLKFISLCPRKYCGGNGDESENTGVVLESIEGRDEKDTAAATATADDGDGNPHHVPSISMFLWQALRSASQRLRLRASDIVEAKRISLPNKAQRERFGQHSQVELGGNKSTTLGRDGTPLRQLLVPLFSALWSTQNAVKDASKPRPRSLLDDDALFVAMVFAATRSSDDQFTSNDKRRIRQGIQGILIPPPSAVVEGVCKSSSWILNVASVVFDDTVQRLASSDLEPERTPKSNTKRLTAAPEVLSENATQLVETIVTWLVDLPPVLHQEVYSGPNNCLMALPATSHIIAVLLMSHLDRAAQLYQKALHQALPPHLSPVGVQQMMRWVAPIRGRLVEVATSMVDRLESLSETTGLHLCPPVGLIQELSCLAVRVGMQRLLDLRQVVASQPPLVRHGDVDEAMMRRIDLFHLLWQTSVQVCKITRCAAWREFAEEGRGICVGINTLLQRVIPLLIAPSFLTTPNSSKEHASGRSGRAGIATKEPSNSHPTAAMNRHETLNQLAAPIAFACDRVIASIHHMHNGKHQDALTCVQELADRLGDEAKGGVSSSVGVLAVFSCSDARDVFVDAACWALTNEAETECSAVEFFADTRNRLRESLRLFKSEGLMSKVLRDTIVEFNLISRHGLQEMSEFASRCIPVEFVEEPHNHEHRKKRGHQWYELVSGLCADVRFHGRRRVTQQILSCIYDIYSLRLRTSRILGCRASDEEDDVGDQTGANERHRAVSPAVPDVCRGLLERLFDSDEEDEAPLEADGDDQQLLHDWKCMGEHLQEWFPNFRTRGRSHIIAGGSKIQQSTLVLEWASSMLHLITTTKVDAIAQRRNALRELPQGSRKDTPAHRTVLKIILDSRLSVLDPRHTFGLEDDIDVQAQDILEALRTLTPQQLATGSALQPTEAVLEFAALVHVIVDWTRRTLLPATADDAQKRTAILSALVQQLQAAQGQSTLHSGTGDTSTGHHESGLVTLLFALANKVESLPGSSVIERHALAVLLKQLQVAPSPEIYGNAVTLATRLVSRVDVAKEELSHWITRLFLRIAEGNCPERVTTQVINAVSLDPARWSFELIIEVSVALLYKTTHDPSVAPHIAEFFARFIAAVLSDDASQDSPIIFFLINTLKKHNPDLLTTILAFTTNQEVLQQRLLALERYCLALDAIASTPPEVVISYFESLADDIDKRCDELNEIVLEVDAADVVADAGNTTGLPAQDLPQLGSENQPSQSRFSSCDHRILSFRDDAIVILEDISDSIEAMVDEVKNVLEARHHPHHACATWFDRAMWYTAATPKTHSLDSHPSVHPEHRSGPAGATVARCREAVRAAGDQLKAMHAGPKPSVAVLTKWKLALFDKLRATCHGIRQDVAGGLRTCTHTLRSIVRDIVIPFFESNGPNTVRSLHDLFGEGNIPDILLKSFPIAMPYSKDKPSKAKEAQSKPFSSSCAASDTKTRSQWHLDVNHLTLTNSQDLPRTLRFKGAPIHASSSAEGRGGKNKKFMPFTRTYLLKGRRKGDHVLKDHTIMTLMQELQRLQLHETYVLQDWVGDLASPASTITHWLLHLKRTWLTTPAQTTSSIFDNKMPKVAPPLFSIFPFSNGGGMIEKAHGFRSLASLMEDWQEEHLADFSRDPHGGETSRRKPLSLEPPATQISEMLKQVIDEINTKNHEARVRGVRGAEIATIELSRPSPAALKECYLRLLRLQPSSREIISAAILSKAEGSGSSLSKPPQHAPKAGSTCVFPLNSDTEWIVKWLSYTASLANGSALTFALGIGDRHLGNILLDPRAALIAHIDFSVCYGAGTRLRFPERVPFRMSPVLMQPLGVFGCEGGFATTTAKLLSRLSENETFITELVGTLHYMFPSGTGNASKTSQRKPRGHFVGSLLRGSLQGEVEQSMTRAWRFFEVVSGHLLQPKVNSTLAPWTDLRQQLHVHGKLRAVAQTGKRLSSLLAAEKQEANRQGVECLSAEVAECELSKAQLTHSIEAHTAEIVEALTGVQETLQALEETYEEVRRLGLGSSCVCWIRATDDSALEEALGSHNTSDIAIWTSAIVKRCHALPDSFPEMECKSADDSLWQEEAPQQTTLRLKRRAWWCSSRSDEVGVVNRGLLSQTHRLVGAQYAAALTMQLFGLTSVTLEGVRLSRREAEEWKSHLLLCDVNQREVISESLRHWSRHTRTTTAWIAQDHACVTIASTMYAALRDLHCLLHQPCFPTSSGPSGSSLRDVRPASWILHESTLNEYSTISSNAIQTLPASDLCAAWFHAIEVFLESSSGDTASQSIHEASEAICDAFHKRFVHAHKEAVFSEDSAVEREVSFERLCTQELSDMVSKAFLQYDETKRYRSNTQFITAVPASAYTVGVNPWVLWSPAAMLPLLEKVVIRVWRWFGDETNAVASSVSKGLSVSSSVRDTRVILLRCTWQNALLSFRAVTWLWTTERLTRSFRTPNVEDVLDEWNRSVEAEDRTNHGTNAESPTSPTSPSTTLRVASLTAPLFFCLRALLQNSNATGDRMLQCVGEWGGLKTHATVTYHVGVLARRVESAADALWMKIARASTESAALSRRLEELRQDHLRQAQRVMVIQEQSRQLSDLLKVSVSPVTLNQLSSTLRQLQVAIEGLFHELNDELGGRILSRMNMVRRNATTAPTGTKSSESVSLDVTPKQIVAQLVEADVAECCAVLNRLHQLIVEGYEPLAARTSRPVQGSWSKVTPAVPTAAALSSQADLPDQVALAVEIGELLRVIDAIFVTCSVDLTSSVHKLMSLLGSLGIDSAMQRAKVVADLFKAGAAAASDVTASHTSEAASNTEGSADVVELHSSSHHRGHGRKRSVQRQTVQSLATMTLQRPRQHFLLTAASDANAHVALAAQQEELSNITDDIRRRLRIAAPLRSPPTPDAMVECAAPSFVKQLIQHSIDPDLLSVMYPGWTAWI